MILEVSGERLEVSGERLEVRDMICEVGECSVRVLAQVWMATSPCCFVSGLSFGGSGMVALCSSLLSMEPRMSVTGSLPPCLWMNHWRR